MTNDERMQARLEQLHLRLNRLKQLQAHTWENTLTASICVTTWNITC